MLSYVTPVSTMLNGKILISLGLVTSTCRNFPDLTLEDGKKSKDFFPSCKDLINDIYDILSLKVACHNFLIL